MCQLFGELEGKQGWIRGDLVEQCEWIYGDMDIQRTTTHDVVALYDFESVVDGDLTFRAGELLTVVETLGEWLRGYCGSRKGIFPSNFVSPFEPQNETAVNLAPPASVLPDQPIQPLLPLMSNYLVTLTQTLSAHSNHKMRRQHKFPRNQPHRPSTFYNLSSSHTARSTAARGTAVNLAPPASVLPDQPIQPLWSGVMKDGYSTEKVQLQVGDLVGVLAEEGGNLYIETVAGADGRLWVPSSIVRNKAAPIAKKTVADGGRTLVLTDSLSKFKADSISKNGLFIYS
eukprot:sb/3467744/